MPVTTITLGESPLADAARFRRFARMTTLTALSVGPPVSGVGEVAASRSLRSLEFHFCPLTDPDVAPLAQLATLRYLHLSGRDLTRTGGDRLASALPACRIAWPGGVVEPRET